jgi:pimeloyl-ACP methyl ester carboxylesterase
MPHSLNYQRYGEGQPPLLVLHGLFGSAKNWHSIARKLEAHYDIWALDLRNHGQSPWDMNMNYPELADDLRHFILQHELTSVHLLGHSMGGKAAMTLALAQPDLVQSLIVVDIAPVNYNHSFMDYVQAMQNINLEGLSRRSEVDQCLSVSIQDAGIRMFLLQNLVFSQDHYDWRINLASLAANMHHLTGFPPIANTIQFNGKTLFLRGEQSEYILPSHQTVIESYFPNAQIETISGAGHWVHADKPNVLIQQVQQFLATT